MIPLRLELRGFTCFRETAVVDLEGLEVELFAISGPTGAGKSTLLDGLTYALYGETVRLGSRSLEALLSPGVDEMMAQISFRSGAEIYRVTRYAERKRSGVVSQVRLERLSLDATWSQLPESEKVREANLKIEALVGLDFDGFTRAVLLPQGEFHEFLRGDATKRRRVLSSLMGLDTVERMQKLAGGFSRDADAEVQAVTTRLEEDYASVTPERLRALRDECATLGGRLAELSERREGIVRELRDLEALKVLWDEKIRLVRELGVLLAKGTEMRASANRVELARRARMLAPQVQSLTEVGARLKRSGEESERAHSAVGRAEARVRKERAALGAAETERDREVPEIERRLEALAEVGPLAERLTARGGSLDLATPLAAGAYRESDWETLQALEAKASEAMRLRNDLRGRRRRVASLREEIARLERTTARREDDLTCLMAEGTEARERASEAEQAFAAAEDADRVASLQAGLGRGDPCPVCGQPVGELPEQARVDLGALRSVWEEARGRVDRLVQRYREIEAILGTERTLLMERRAALGELEGETVRLQSTFGGLAASFAEVGMLVDDDLALELQRRRQALLGGLAREVLDRTGGEDPVRLRRRLLTCRGELEAGLRRAGDSLAAAEQELERHRTALALHERRSAELERELVTLEDRTRSLLREAGFASSEEVVAAALPEEEVASLERELERYRSECEAVRRRLVEVEGQRAGRELDEGALEQKRIAAVALGHELGELQASRGRAEQELRHLEERFERASELRARLKRAQGRYSTFRALHLDLRGDRFQEFLMTRVQDRLALRASYIMRAVTDGRYDLLLVEGEYYVKDAWNTDGLRSARTLSGGETFIASLALALALSDTLAGNRTLGALFLDEGFGSLDGLTLDAVASVLENLTREGRMVGVVTHLDALTERMPARLVVRKGPEGSSVRWDL
ncbi:MAG: SMC family ATPase [Truepera sp.]|nr:SMC family ATPase [Truepera sp.]